MIRLVLPFSVLLLSSLGVAQQKEQPRPPIDGVWKLDKIRSDSTGVEDLVLRIKFPKGAVQRMVQVREHTKDGERSSNRIIYFFGERRRTSQPGNWVRETTTTVRWRRGVLRAESYAQWRRPAESRRTITLTSWDLKNPNTLLVTTRVNRDLGWRVTQEYFTRVGKIKNTKKSGKGKKSKATS